MSIVKKSFAYDNIVSHIQAMKISSKSQKLLQFLFEGKTKEAANILKSYSFTATSDVSITVMAAGILVCAYKSGYKSIDDTGLKTEMDKLFRQLGFGNGSSAKSAISTHFPKAITHLTSLAGLKDTKGKIIADNIQNRIGKISKWNRSSGKVKEHILPIFEKVLCNALYSNFYIAFNNRTIKNEAPDLSRISSVAEDGLSQLCTNNGPITNYLAKLMASKLDKKNILTSGNEPSIYIKILRKNSLKDEREYKKANTTDKNSIPLYYEICNFYDKKNDDIPVRICLNESDVLKVLREANGNPDQCARLLLKYTQDQLPEIKAAMNEKKREKMASTGKNKTKN